MCDYSLFGHFKNRLAVKGEVLVTHKFATGSIGMISEKQAATPVADIAPMDYCAVCLPHGTTVEIISQPTGASWWTHFRLFAGEAQYNAVPSGMKGVFVQTSAQVGRHRDAIKLESEAEPILLQCLRPGLRFRVGQVVAEETVPEESGTDTAPEQEPAEAMAGHWSR